MVAEDTGTASNIPGVSFTFSPQLGLSLADYPLPPPPNQQSKESGRVQS